MEGILNHLQIYSEYHNCVNIYKRIIRKYRCLQSPFSNCDKIETRPLRDIIHN